AALNYFEIFSGKKLNGNYGEVVVKKVSKIQSDKILSISYLVMVFGEYIISVSNKFSNQVFADFGEDNETIEGCLKEVLNMISGKSISHLGNSYQKLTITAPKVINGSLALADLELGCVVIQTDFGEINCYIYIDRMKLDLVSSYNETIDILKETNTQLGDANKKLQEQQAQLVHQEKMASLGILAAGVAHEINNPLTYISGNIELLTSYVEAMKSIINLYERLTQNIVESVSVKKFIDYEEFNQVKEKEKIQFIIQDTAKIIEESRIGIEKISKIVLALKKFSKFEDGKSKSINIADEINDVITILNSEIQNKGCQVKINFTKLPKLSFQSFGLTQVFTNLIINSLDAVKKNEGLINIEGFTENNDLVLKFKDNGAGISPENQTKIFNPFFTTKNVGEGTGLGLAISHGIIERHNGKIQVMSELGKGTEFKIQIPIPSPQ
ncbi:MAG: ATP-binding protein, partial [Bdellovibrionaceae bacterium]|nr:ATP-binding protein [Pseudobdellovibrionaceae bacterium]